MSYNLQKLIKVMNKKSQTIYNAIHYLYKEKT